MEVSGLQMEMSAESKREKLENFPYFPCEGKTRYFSRISEGRETLYINITFPFPSLSVIEKKSGGLSTCPPHTFLLL